MKITIESTPTITTVNGVPARIWMGTTEAGVQIAAVVQNVVCLDEAADGERAVPEFATLQQTDPPLELRQALAKVLASAHSLMAAIGACACGAGRRDVDQDRVTGGTVIECTNCSRMVAGDTRAEAEAMWNAAADAMAKRITAGARP